MTQVDDQVKRRLNSKLIKAISPSLILRVLKKLLKYFNCTAISTFFLLPAAGDFPVIFALNLNDSESAIGTSSFSPRISL